MHLAEKADGRLKTGTINSTATVEKNLKKSIFKKKIEKKIKIKQIKAA